MDALGAETRYGYDAMGRLVSETDALGNVLTWEYDGNGNLICEKDANGAETKYVCDAAGNVTEKIQPDGGRYTYAYDGLGNIMTETDPLGAVTDYAYDAKGQMVKMTDPLGQEAHFSYDALGNLTSIGLPGSEKKYEYDTSGQITAITDALGNKTEYKYDLSGQPICETVNGNDTLYEYDVNGNITKVTDAENHSVSFTYDPYGRMLETCYPDNSRDTYTYDALGRLVIKETRDGRTTSYLYNACGDLLEEYSDNGSILYEYDALGIKISEDENGARTEYSYDGAGNLVSKTEPDGTVTAYEYDSMGRLSAVGHAGDIRTEAVYDAVGNLLSETDGEGNTTRYHYDPAGRLTSVTDALGNETSYVYNAMDEVEEITDPLGHRTAYSYDASGRLTGETDALGNTVRYSYSPEGWLSGITRPDGSCVSYKRDKAGNVLEELYNGETVKRNTWNEQGLLATAENSSGKMRFGLDSRGNLTDVAYGNGQNVRYAYNEDNTLSEITYPDGKRVSYSYDDCGRISTVTAPDGKETSYGYDLSGRIVSQEDGCTSAKYCYNEMGLISEILVSGDAPVALSYEYDRNGNITGETRTEDGKVIRSTYAYDALGQLVSYETEGLAEHYTYDAAGNMTEYVREDETGTHRTAMAYDEANRLISRRGSRGTVEYRYDANGNLVSKNLGEKEDSYTYDESGYLSTYTGYDGYTARYGYNALGLLEKKAEQGAGVRPSLEALADGREQPAFVDGEERVTGYVYDIVPENAQLLSETADGRITDYVYGNTRLAAYSGDGQEALRYICDARGSVIRTTDGRVTRSCRYLPYGEQITGSGDEKKSGYAFNGEYCDAASNMQYLRARWYEPAMMRFGQQDPLAGDMYQPLTVNRYAYVINNPVTYADPSGEAGGRYRTGNYRTIQYGEGTYQNSSSRNTGHWTSDYRTYHYDRSVTHYRTGDYRTVNYADTYNSSTYRSGSYRTVNLAPVKKYIKVENSAALSNILENMGENRSYDQLIIRIQGASVRVRNKTEAWAVVDALNAFEKMPNTDSWSVIKKNTMLNQACRSYAGLAERRKEYTEYWQQKNGYFEGHWWQDSKKRDEATKMLLNEIREKGTLDLIQLGVDGQRRKIEFLEELVNVGSKTGEWGNPLLTGMENSLAAMRMDKSPYTLDEETLDALKTRHDANRWKGLNYWLENGGTEVIMGVMTLVAATGAKIYNDVQDRKIATELKGNSGENGSTTINPHKIRYSQTSVNGSSDIIQKMKKNGWKGEPIDVVKMPDGMYTTIDNTRVVAAREAGISVRANVHAYNDLLPSNFIGRFTTKKGIPETWGDAIELRIGKQKASFRKEYPYGCFDMETIK